MRDSKFGFHILWMVPLYYTYEVYDYIVELKRRNRIRRISKDPEIAELARLAGINKDKK